MKKHLATTVLALACAFTPVKAQERPATRDSVTIPQRAEIKSKKLGLALDLNKEQIRKVARAEQTKLEAFRKLKVSGKKNRTEVNSRPSMRNPEMEIKVLDLRLAYQSEMKTILSPEQYAKWKKIQRHIKRREQTPGQQKRHRQGAPGRRG